MRGILSDICIEAQVRVLLTVLNGPFWLDLWSDLALTHRTFRDVGLAPNTPDSGVWELCQREGLVLITANRNQDGPDSLETTIQERNDPTCLPVFTISSAGTIFHSRDYVERVTESLVDHLLQIDNLRGTGRLYLP